MKKMTLGLRILFACNGLMFPMGPENIQAMDPQEDCEEYVEVEMTHEEYEAEMAQLDKELEEDSKELKQNHIKRAREHFAQGEQYLKEENFEKAQEMFQKVFDEEDAESELRGEAGLHVACIFIAVLDDFWKGIEMYEEVAKMDDAQSAQLEAWKLLGYYYAVKDSFDDQLEAQSDATTYEPLDFEAGFDYFQKLADQDRDKKLKAFGKFSVALLILQADKFKDQRTRAMPYLMEAGKQDDNKQVKVEAWATIADCALYGWGMEQDEGMYTFFLSLVAQQDDCTHPKKIALAKLMLDYGNPCWTQYMIASPGYFQKQLKMISEKKDHNIQLIRQKQSEYKDKQNNETQQKQPKHENDRYVEQFMQQAEGFAKKFGLENHKDKQVHMFLNQVALHQNDLYQTITMLTDEHGPLTLCYDRSRLGKTIYEKMFDHNGVYILIEQTDDFITRLSIPSERISLHRFLPLRRALNHLACLRSQALKNSSQNQHVTFIEHGLNAIGTALVGTYEEQKKLSDVLNTLCRALKNNDLEHAQNCSLLLQRLLKPKNKSMNNNEQWKAELDEIAKELRIINKEITTNNIERARRFLAQGQKFLNEKNTKAAQEMFTSALDQEDAEGEIQAQAGIHLAEDIAITALGDYCKGSAAYEQVAQMDQEPIAQMVAWKRLGDLYATGMFELPRNRPRAVHYFKKLARQNKDKKLKVYGAFRLGEIYLIYYGDGCQDQKLAISYFDEVARQTDDLTLKIRSWLYLAEIAHCGWGMEKNFDKKIEYLSRAANQDDDIELKCKALFELGFSYLGVTNNFKEKKDLKLALKFMRSVADTTSDKSLEGEARLIMAQIQFIGYDETGPDYEKSFREIKKIADEQLGPNDYPAQANLFFGNIFRYGLFEAEIDPTNAAYYYIKAHQSKGKEYIEGHIKKALFWARKQAENGNINVSD